MGQARAGAGARARARTPPAARRAGARRRARAQGMLLRRTKATLIDGAPVVDLPERRVTLRRIAFSPPERAFYERVQQESARELKARARAPRGPHPARLTRPSSDARLKWPGGAE